MEHQLNWKSKVKERTQPTIHWLQKDRNRNLPSILMGVLLLFCSGYFIFHLHSLGERMEQGDIIAAQTEISAFEQYLQQLFVEQVSEDALTLQYTLKNPEIYGITAAKNSGLGNYSKQALQESYTQLKKEQIELLNFDPRELSEKEKLTYNILLDWIQTSLDGEEYIMYQESWGSITGTQAQLPVLLAEYPIEDVDDVEQYLTLLAQVDDYLMEMLAFEQERTAAGLGMTDSEISRVVQQCDTFSKTGEECYLIDSFAERVEQLEGLTKEEIASYETRNSEIVQQEVLKGYSQLATELEQLKTGADGGLCRLPEGQNYYSWLVKEETGSSKTVPELKAAIYAQLKENLTSINGIYLLNPDAGEEATKAEFSLSEPQQILEDLKEKMEADFPKAAQASFEIKTVPESMQDYLSPAFYIIPRLDDMEENVIYINEGKNGYGSTQNYSVLAHEGYPGHLYQTTYFQSTNPYEIRSLLNYPGYIEGWATYAEQYSYGLSGDFSDEVSKLKEISSVVTLGLYALMDIGVHYDGWSREQMQDFVQSYFAVEDADTANEIYDMILEDPAGYLSYYVGYLEILELKEEMKEILGDDFTDMKFHEKLLEIGPASFAVIGRNME